MIKYYNQSESYTEWVKIYMIDLIELYNIFVTMFNKNYENNIKWQQNFTNFTRVIYKKSSSFTSYKPKSVRAPLPINTKACKIQKYV